MRDPRHLDLDRDRDLLLHLLGGATRPLRYHRHVVVGDVRVGLDRQVVEGEGAPGEEQDSCRQDHELVGESEVDQLANHLCVSRSVVRLPDRLNSRAAWPALIDASAVLLPHLAAAAFSPRRPATCPPHPKNCVPIERMCGQSSSARSRTSASLTTVWPGLSPDLTSCSSPGSVLPATTSTRRNCWSVVGR